MGDKIVSLVYDDCSSVEILADCLVPILNDNTAIVCIGTDKCIVDSLGPMVGTLLKENNIGIDVYGSLNYPVHALNLVSCLSCLKSKKYDTIIAVDACLSGKVDSGTVELICGNITPGKGVGKCLPCVGDYSIVGVIDSNEKEFDELVHDVRLSFVYNMAKVIADSIVLALENSSVVSEVALNET